MAAAAVAERVEASPRCASPRGAEAAAGPEVLGLHAGELVAGRYAQVRHRRFSAPPGAAAEAGELLLTNFRLLFLPEGTDAGRVNHCLLQCSSSVPLACIGKAEQQAQGDGRCTVVLHCKDSRTVAFEFGGPLDGRLSGFFERLQFPLFSFYILAYLDDAAPPAAAAAGGIEPADPRVPGRGLDAWRETDANTGYALCATYPSRLVVPAATTDEQLAAVAQFRSKARLPVLSWVHPDTEAALLRCAQPLAGITGARCADDELLVRQIREACPRAKHLYILDCRPRVNALGQSLLGAGYENMTGYPDCSLDFLGIENIHTLRSALARLEQALAQDPTTMTRATLTAAVEASGWYQQIQAILSGARRVVDTLDAGDAVLCHCSDGWDRTTQICALAQIMRDPQCRTIAGFLELVDREWITFGHKFADRCAHPAAGSPVSEYEFSPVFPAFLDCVWQCLEAHPAAFEFTDKLLLRIFADLYPCRFGTFLFNSERERIANRVNEATQCLWTEILAAAEAFRNPDYAPAAAPDVAAPKPGASVGLWAARYLYWHVVDRLTLDMPAPDEGRDVVALCAEVRVL